MRLEQLEYLVAVAESGSFRTAAQKLNISRPAVSVALKSLEDELGETLFIKESRGIRLTPLGHLAVEKAGADKRAACRKRQQRGRKGVFR